MFENILKSGFIKPSLAFIVFKKELEKQVGSKIQEFEVSYIAEFEKLTIDVQKVNSDKIERYFFEQEKDLLVRGVKAITNKELKNGTLDAFQIHLGKESFLCIYYTDENKTQNIQKINL